MIILPYYLQKSYLQENSMSTAKVNHAAEVNPATEINEHTLEETASYVTPDFPYRTDLCRLDTIPQCTFPWHWHNDVELFYMREGQLDYTLPSGTYTFLEGEGGFINSGVLHMTSCPEGQISLQEEHIFLPQFIGGSQDSVLTQRYILPITNNAGLDLFRFDPTIPEHKKIIELLRQSYDFYSKKQEGYEFDVRESMTKVWRLIFALTKDSHNTSFSTHKNERLKTMMAYIAAHYSEKLTLQQIADSSYISIRECCRCFKENLGISPFSYLMDYRLRKVCDFLIHTDTPITDIGSACGFGSTSYLGKEFKARFHCSPREYRQRHQPKSSRGELL